MRDQLSSDDVAVVLSPDSGERYIDTVYNDEWVESRFGQQALSATLDGPAFQQCIISLPRCVDQPELHRL